jgi:hypothetical protein
MRPGAKDANMTPAQACASLALTFSKLPEARQHFVAEGGLLAAMELLDSEAQRVLEPLLELINTFIGGDARNLHALCMMGMVPAVCRCAPARGGVHAAAPCASCRAALGGAGSVPGPRPQPSRGAP